MTYLQINENTPQGKKMVEFLKTQRYTKILDKPNAATRKAIREARAGITKKTKGVKDLLKQTLG